MADKSAESDVDRMRREYEELISRLKVSKQEKGDEEGEKDDDNSSSSDSENDSEESEESSSSSEEESDDDDFGTNSKGTGILLSNAKPVLRLGNAPPASSAAPKQKQSIVVAFSAPILVASRPEVTIDASKLEVTQVFIMLRRRGQPITYFAETHDDRVERLQFLLNAESEAKQQPAAAAAAAMEQELKLKAVEKAAKAATASRTYYTAKQFGSAEASSSGSIENAKEQEQSEDVFAGMDDRQKKLFALRMRMNEGRKANSQAVVQEARREVEGPEAEYKRSKQAADEKRAYMAKLKKEGKLEEEGAGEKKKQQGSDSEGEEAEDEGEKKWKGRDWKSYTSEEANAISHKKSGKGRQDAFTTDGVFNAHEKRVQRAEVSFEQFVAARKKLAEMEGVEYGTHKPAAADLDRMVKELQKQDEHRAQFKRRRQVYEEQDIDYINESNRQFNRKISRAFDKYTIGIKQNLERGTAI